MSLSAHAATITVNTLVDENTSNSDCSLREAITAANNNAAYLGCTAGSGADLIDFSVTGTILLGSTLPSISGALSIIGPGAGSLTIDADEQYRFFYFNFANEVQEFRLEKMTLTDGSTSLGGYPAVHVLDNVSLVMEDMVISGMRLTPNGSGAAIGGQNASVTIRRSTFFNNGAVAGSAGAISIASSMIVVVEDSTFENNFANGNGGGIGNGGAISVGNGGNLTIRRSTFSGNSAGDRGGAIAVFASNAVLNIENSTFANNTAATTGGALDMNAGTATISNSLFALNHISGMAVGDPTININLGGSGVINTLGYNGITDNSGATVAFPAGVPNINNDYAGTALNTLNARIDALADNGGPTRTHALQSSSGLLDAGSCTGETRDQRGYSNPINPGRIIDLPGPDNADDGCDVGAFERGAQPPVLNFTDGFEDPPGD